MTTTTITSKGQILVPVAIRRNLRLKKGMRFSIVQHNGQIVLSPMTKEYFNSIAGIARTDGTLTETLIAGRRKEHAIEERKSKERMGWSKK